MSDELNFNVPIRLNSFGETIRRIEAERLEEAKQAVEDGWTEDDHPNKCCPPKKAQPKPKGRPIEEVQRLLDRALDKGKQWTDAMNRLQTELDRTDANRPKFDHGMMQLSLKTRRKGMSREMQTWRSLEHAKERVIHYQNLAGKYQDQINKRSK